MSNMVVNTNVLALNSHRSLKGVGEQNAKASGRLSSGMRINSAADDAAGLAISEKMRAQIRGLDMASKNSQDAMSLIQTAEGGMQEINNMLQRMRELIDYASNDTNEHNSAGTGDRQKIQDELNQLTEEIDSMAERVEFNKKRLINGSFSDLKGELSRAQTIRDTASLDKTAGDARFTALLDELGAPGSGSMGTTNALGALGSLSTAQGILTQYVENTYQSAITSFTTAKVNYEAAMREYEVAKNQLQEAMGTANIASTAALRDNHISVTNPSYTGEANAAALISAVERYANAAVALGLDELRLGSSASLTAASWGSGGGLTAVSNATASLVTSRSEIPLMGEMLTFQSAQVQFQADQLEYQGVLNTRDVAQAKVDTLNNMITEARRELTSANARFNASDISFAAASEADKANSARPLHFQVGANANQSLIMSIGSLKTTTLGIGDGKGNSRLNVLQNTGANITAQLDILDQALSYVSTERAKLGAAQNRMEYTIKSLDISSENLSASESRIRDADMAKEMMNVTKSNVLQQAAISMLAQANQAPQSVLQLLR